MKVTWQKGVSMLAVSIIVVFAVVFWLVNRPLVTVNQAEMIAKKELAMLDTHIPKHIMSTINIGWYHDGRPFQTGMVYLYVATFQTGPGAHPTNVELIINARDGEVLSAFRLYSGFPPIQSQGPF